MARRFFPKRFGRSCSVIVCGMVFSGFGAITAMVPNDTRFSTASLGFLLDKMALFLAVAGTVSLLIPTFQDQGEPTLNNYIPVIINPIYYAGLVCWLRGSLFPSCAC